MIKNKALKFNYNVDDVFIILMDQKSAEFAFIHNNNFKCECSFCNEFQRGVLNVDTNLGKILGRYRVKARKKRTKV